MNRRPIFPIHVVHHLSPETVQALRGDGTYILAAITRMKEQIMSAIDDVRSAFSAYATKVDAYIAGQEAFKKTVEEAVAAAIIADDAEEEGVLTTLRDDIATASGKVPPPPATPTP